MFGTRVFTEGGVMLLAEVEGIETEIWLFNDGTTVGALIVGKRGVGCCATGDVCCC